MFRTTSKLVALLVLVALLAGFSPTVAASSNYVQITGINSTTCTPGGIIGVDLYYVAGSGTLTHTWTNVNAAQGTSTSNTATIFGPAAGSSGSWSIDVPANTQAGDTLKITVIVPKSDADESGSLSSITFNCSTGAVISSEFIIDYPAGGDPGPAIPDGYVLRTITCDVAVFDAPGGNPVGDNRIKAGQTFYVSPDATADASGANWSQVFVSSRSNPWIPTRCIGKTANGY
ncbi:MAG: hypothetical protein KF716_33935 [Anaerolineae bacterium]|nr:hypothetical protein [Anaerolineae bacterium]